MESVKFLSKQTSLASHTLCRRVWLVRLHTDYCESVLSKSIAADLKFFRFTTYIFVAVKELWPSSEPKWL